jgi:hypothetical protein
VETREIKAMKPFEISPFRMTELNGRIYHEQEVLKLRNAIYGESTEHNWKECREKWMTPENVQWLLDHQPNTP